jgi:hypothetical protein
MGKRRTLQRNGASTRIASGTGKDMQHASHAASSLVDRCPPISCPGWTMLALGRGDPQGTGMEGGDSDRPGRGDDWVSRSMVRRSRRQRWNRSYAPLATTHHPTHIRSNLHFSAVGLIMPDHQRSQRNDTQREATGCRAHERTPTLRTISPFSSNLVAPRLTTFAGCAMRRNGAVVSAMRRHAGPQTETSTPSHVRLCGESHCLESSGAVSNTVDQAGTAHAAVR